MPRVAYAVVDSNQTTTGRWSFGIDGESRLWSDFDALFIAMTGREYTNGIAAVYRRSTTGDGPRLQLKVFAAYKEGYTPTGMMGTNTVDFVLAVMNEMFPGEEVKRGDLVDDTDTPWAMPACDTPEDVMRCTWLLPRILAEVTSVHEVPGPVDPGTVLTALREEEGASLRELLGPLGALQATGISARSGSLDWMSREQMIDNASAGEPTARLYAAMPYRREPRFDATLHGQTSMPPRRD